MGQLTPDMIMVLVMIGLAIFLFIVEWIRVDVVAILMMVALPLLHLVTPKEAFVGLSSNAVVSIIAVIIIGAGLDKTGMINKLVKPVLAVAGTSTSRIIVAISFTVAVISSFMQNIGAAALFLPAIQRISKMQKIPLSRLLMPVGFSAILGGTITLVGCSPLILLNDLLLPFNLKPFGLFDVTPIGLTLVAGGIACFIVLGRFILPQGECQGTEDNEAFCTIGGLMAEEENVNSHYELTTSQDFMDYRDPVRVEDLRRRYLVNVLALTEPPDFKTLSPSPESEIRAGVDLVVCGRQQDVERMALAEEMELKETIDCYSSELDTSISGTVEAVVSPRSQFAGMTLADIRIQDRFRVTPLEIHRQEETYRAEIDSIALQTGDVIRFYGTWKRLESLHREGGLLFSMPSDLEDMRPEKALWAGAWLVLSLVMIMIFDIQLSVALMTGALGMVVTRVISIDEAYQSVDWRTIFLLAGLIPLGIATQKTGTAEWIAGSILNIIGDVSPIVLMTVIGILSTMFTLVISNVGATVLLVPLVVNMALAAGADPRMAALVVGLATSNSFMLPTHQVNALYMGPGRYRTVDFIKAGSLVSVIFLVVMIAMISLIYGI
ncbi:TrkA-C domain-containing protein [Desulfocicer vacuolatum DSM 3385]|uniref:TrkA-C domain-containing protein n=1 Tax=Desulfocicer vacuolatum DSM 3385 TaxID=1121400 RepID=A0A1W2DQR3_9BACT|nr:SLC13 family permease [Desulfocicer vacuolatum]SMC99376.1 TrkA-C domain-containing protein [Desulfocicer vacuolatum DSM 3385]